jgi:hypothetical protein
MSGAVRQRGQVRAWFGGSGALGSGSAIMHALHIAPLNPGLPQK